MARRSTCVVVCSKFLQRAAKFYSYIVIIVIKILFWGEFTCSLANAPNLLL